MKNRSVRSISGGVTAAEGFLAAGVMAGIKSTSALDLGLIYSRYPCSAAGAFTTNSVRAPCVDWSAAHTPSKSIRAIICNSGNANACTGAQGEKDVCTMAKLAAEAMGINKDNVLVASTGIIGRYLPMERVKPAIGLLAKSLVSEGGNMFAKAIMTTDTRPKEWAVEVKVGKKKFRIGGACKGAGMIHPNMATMLAFITTDAAIDETLLDSIVKSTVDSTFNMVSVDGDTSTNDMVLVLANGASNTAIKSNSEIAAFQQALLNVCDNLCQKIASDGEGATKLVTVVVKEAASTEQARLAARTIARSTLVKCALFGNDPNWGRILCAIGYSGAKFDKNKIKVRIAGTTVCKNLRPAAFDASKVSRAIAKPQVLIEVYLGAGKAHAIAHTCDLSYDYVKINAQYHT